MTINEIVENQVFKVWAGLRIINRRLENPENKQLPFIYPYHVDDVDWEKLEGCYQYSYGVLTFVYEGNLYAAPGGYLKSHLQENGFKCSCAVPPIFCFGDEPYEDNWLWQALKANVA